MDADMEAQLNAQVDAMFEQADANKDGVLTIEEIEAVAAGMGKPIDPANKAELEAIFKAMDTNGDGKVDKAELKAFFMKMMQGMMAAMGGAME